MNDEDLITRIATARATDRERSQAALEKVFDSWDSLGELDEAAENMVFSVAEIPRREPYPEAPVKSESDELHEHAGFPPAAPEATKVALLATAAKKHSEPAPEVLTLKPESETRPSLIAEETHPAAEPAPVTQKREPEFFTGNSRIDRDLKRQLAGVSHTLLNQLLNGQVTIEKLMEIAQQAIADAEAAIWMVERAKQLGKPPATTDEYLEIAKSVLRNIEPYRKYVPTIEDPKVVYYALGQIVTAAITAECYANIGRKE